MSRPVHCASALQVLWTSLAYLAASLRTDEGFDLVPAEIADLPGWREFVAQWWDECLRLLGQIPLSLDVDVAATGSSRSSSRHLQVWADEMGFEFHDVPSGGGFFRIKLWD